MAYNPFNIFRRNQKVIFAVLTIFIMFMFTLSSGVMGGDFFDWFPRWLGTKSQKGDVMCSIDGSKVYSGELEKLRFNRVMANRYMTQGALHTRHRLDSYVEEQAAGLSPEVQMTLGQIIRSERQFSENPQLAAMFLPQMLPQMRSELSRLLRLPNLKKSDEDAIRVKLASMTLMQSILFSGGEQQYFGNAPNNTSRDLVNFMLWQKKADQLGIKFTTDDIKKLIDREFYSFFQGESQVFVQKELQKSLSGFNLSRCIEAVGEEFRVRMAQVAVLGPDVLGRRGDKTYGGFPAFSTPFEQFEFYRDKCSPTTYVAIPVPAINYIASIPDPDVNNPAIKAELREMFDKYRNDEPNQGREAPGLKEPRRIKIEWLAVTGAEPYYVKEAEQKLSNERLQADLRSVIAAPSLGLTPATIFNARAFAEDPILAREYERQVQDHKFALNSRFNTANMYMFDLLSTSIVRPGNLASAAGGVAGQFLAFGNPFAAVAGSTTAPLAYEIRDRIKAGMPLFLGAVPGPGLFSTLTGGELAYRESLPKTLPLAVWQPDLLKSLSRETAKKIAFGETRNQFDFSAPTPDPKKKGDLQTFIDEVNKLSDNGRLRPTDKDKMAALRKYIDEFVAKRGLKIVGNKNPQSEWTMEEDPELAVLVDVQKKSLVGSPHQRADYIPFANRFFWERGDRRLPVSGTYKPEFYPEQKPATDPFATEPKPQYVVWRTEEISSKAPPSFDDALPALKAAWKQKKAREVAKDRADKLADAIRAGGAGGAALIPFTVLDQANALAAEFANNPKARDRIMPFPIEGVCPLTPVTNPTAGKGVFPGPAPLPSAQLTEFRLPPSENLKYPSREMGKTLLDDRTKPEKTVLVLPDEPKDIYFVITLVKREPKTEREFQTAVYSADPLGGRGNPTRAIVLEAFARDAQIKTIESVMGLLKREFKFEESDEQKKKLDERRASEQ